MSSSRSEHANVIAVGVLILQRELDASTSHAALETLHRLELALARVVSVLAANNPRPDE